MNWALDSIARVAGTGRIFIRTALALLMTGGLCLPSPAAEIKKGVPETPSDAAAVAEAYKALRLEQRRKLSMAGIQALALIALRVLLDIAGFLLLAGRPGAGSEPRPA